MSCSLDRYHEEQKKQESFDVFKRDVFEMCCGGIFVKLKHHRRFEFIPVHLVSETLEKVLWIQKCGKKERERKVSVSNGKQKTLRKRIRENHAENILIIRYTMRNAWYIHVYNLTNGRRNDAGTTGEGPLYVSYSCLIYGRIIKIQWKFFLPLLYAKIIFEMVRSQSYIITWMSRDSQR